MTPRELELTNVVQEQAARIAELEAVVEELGDEVRNKHTHVMQDWRTKCGSCGTCNLCCGCCKETP